MTIACKYKEEIKRELYEILTSIESHSGNYNTLL